MSRRTQITLEDAQYERLLAESRSSGVGLAELIRRAVDQMYGRTSSDEFAGALDISFGTWEAEPLDGEQYVESIRSARTDRFAEW